MLRGLQLVGGFALIALGLAGVLLPIMPGMPFLLIGAALLGHDHPLVRPFKKRLERWRGARRHATTASPTRQPVASLPSTNDGLQRPEERNL